jgi:lipoprotein NlpI
MPKFQISLQTMGPYVDVEVEAKDVTEAFEKVFIDRDYEYKGNACGWKIDWYGCRVQLSQGEVQAFRMDDGEQVFPDLNEKLVQEAMK